MQIAQSLIQESNGNDLWKDLGSKKNKLDLHYYCFFLCKMYIKQNELLNGTMQGQWRSLAFAEFPPQVPRHLQPDTSRSHDSV